MPASANGAIQPKHLRLDQERIDDPEERRGEMPGARQPADGEGAAAARVPSSSQSSTGSARNSTAGCDTGGCASAVAAPASDGQPPPAASPSSAATRRAMRGHAVGARLFRRLRGRPGRQPRPAAA